MRSAYKQFSGGIYLVVSKFLTFGLGPVIGFALIRYLGLEEFGHFSAALALVTLCALVFEAGIQQGLHKRGAGTLHGLKDLAVTGRLLGTLLSIAGTGVILLFAHLAMPERSALLATLLLPLFWRSNQLNVVSSVLRSRGKFVAVGNLNILTSVTAWGPMLVLMLAGASLERMILITQICVIVFMVCVEIYFWIYVRSEPPREPLPLKTLCMESLPFGASALLHQLYYRTDTLIISATRTATEVGQFNIGARLMDVFNVFIGIVYNQLLYPKYFGWVKSAPDRIPVVFRLALMISVVAAMMGAVVIISVADEIVMLLLGHEDRNTAIAVSILSLALVPKFAAVAYEAILSTNGLMDKRLKIQGVLVIANLGLNLALIPRFGMIAAACAVVITNIVFFAAVSFTVQRYTKIRAPGGIGVTALCMSAVLGVFLLSGLDDEQVNLALLAAVVAGVAALGAAVVWKPVKQDIKYIRQWMDRS